MSAFWDTRDQNARIRKRFVPCFVSVIVCRASDFARVRRLNALLPCTRSTRAASGVWRAPIADNEARNSSFNTMTQGRSYIHDDALQAIEAVRWLDGADGRMAKVDGSSGS